MSVAPTIYDLATVADVIAYISPSLGPTDETKLQSYLTGVSRWIAKYLSRDTDDGSGLHAAQWVERRNGNGRGVMKAQRFPIASVQSVQIAPIANATPRTVAPNMVTWDRYFIYLLSQVFPVGPQNVILSYSAGYNTPGQVALKTTVEGLPPLPDDLWMATVKLTALIYKNRSRVGDSGFGVGPEHVSFMMDSMDKQTADMLNHHREVVPHE